MTLGNASLYLRMALNHAQYEGFPNHDYQERDWEHYRNNNVDDDIKYVTKTRKHYPQELVVYNMFLQTWSSTALGFGGIGGQAITQAYTVIIESTLGYGYCVYFNNKFAYRIEHPNDLFHHDIIHRQMASVKEHNKYNN